MRIDKKKVALALKVASALVLGYSAVTYVRKRRAKQNPVLEESKEVLAIPSTESPTGADESFAKRMERLEKEVSAQIDAVHIMNARVSEAVNFSKNNAVHFDIAKLENCEMQQKILSEKFNLLFNRIDDTNREVDQIKHNVRMGQFR